MNKETARGVVVTVLSLMLAAGGVGFGYFVHQKTMNDRSIAQDTRRAADGLDALKAAADLQNKTFEEEMACTVTRHVYNEREFAFICSKSLRDCAEEEASRRAKDPKRGRVVTEIVCTTR